ncbi:MAG: aldo/keto reductase [Mycetocola sp.]
MSTIGPSDEHWLRPLGATGLTVPAITAGGGPLGSMPQVFGVEVSAQQGVQMAEEILSSPVTAIDTSNGYSDGESERRIGVALAARGGVPEGFLVATKVDPRDGDFSGARVRASVEESRARLGLDVLPLVSLHDPEFHGSAGLDLPGGAVDVLVELRDEGVIGSLGVAGGHTDTLRHYLDLGVFDTVLTHSRLTLLDRGADQLVADARAEGLGIMNAAVLGGGLLASRTAKPNYGFRPANERVLRAAAALHDLADEAGVRLADAAIQASVRDTRVDTTVVGMSSPGRVNATLRALEAPIPDWFWQRAAELMPEAEAWLDAAPTEESAR